MSIYWSTPAWLWPLLLIGAAGAVLWVVRAYRQTRPAPPAHLGKVLIWLRSAALLLLFLALAGPVLSQLLVRTRPAEVAIVIEDSGSMQIGATGDGAADRWAQALAVAGAVDSLLQTAPDPVQSVLLRGNGLASVAEFRRDDPVVPEPTAHGTSLTGLLEQTADRLAGRPVRATVVISDGQETEAWDRATGRRGLRRSAGPVFVVGVGDAEGPPDRVLKDLRYPDTAYAGDEVVVEFSVDHRYLAGSEPSRERTITTRLLGPAGPVAEATVTSPEKLVPFVLSFVPEGLGLQAYDLEVEVMDNERFPANNKASLAINVRQERARVLLLAPSPSWDVRFLAQAAAAEQRLELAVVHPAAAGLVYADSLVPWLAPTTAAAWRQWDAVVLMGWNGPLQSLDWQSLGAALDQGLGLLVIAGGSSGRNGLPDPFAPPPDLAAILPVDSTGWRWLPGPFFARVPSAGSGHPLLGGVSGADQLPGTGAGQTSDGLTGLPPLAQVAAVKAATGAEVLLQGSKRGDSAETAQVLLAVAGRGQGRVAWFGGRHLWEWTFWEDQRAKAESAANDHVGRRLARNLLVWTAAGLEESGLVFTGRQSFFQEGEPIRLRAQWLDMRGRPVQDRGLSLILRGGPAAADSLRERTYALQNSAARAGQAEVTLPPLAPGRYTVQLAGEGDPPELGREEALIVADHSLEMTQVRLDRRRLMQLAATRNGTYYAAANPADRRELAADLLAVSWRGDRVDQRQRLELRAGWPLLILVVVLLGAEWYLRRRHGLL